MAYLETHEADIIFMDCLMSEMDGFATTRRIKNMNTYNHTPVIALTANTMKEYEERCFKRYMNGFLAKPFNKDDWQKAKQSGTYGGSKKDIEDGYIHFSEEDQVEETLRRHYPKKENLQNQTRGLIRAFKIRKKV